MKKWLLHIIISLLIIIILWSQFGNFTAINIDEINIPKLIGFGFFIYLLLNLFRAIKYSVLSSNYIMFKNLLPLVFLYNFFVNLLPMRTGELSFFILAKKYKVSSLENSISLIYFAKLVDIIVLIFLFQLSYLFFQTERLVFENGSLLISLIIQFILFFCLIQPRHLFSLLDKLLAAIKINKLQNTLNMIRSKLEYALINLKGFFSVKRFTKALALSTLMYLSMVLFYSSILTVLNVNIAIGSLIYLSILAIVIGSVPIGIAGVGTIEAGLTGTLILVGIEPSIALSLSLIVHGVQVLCYVLLGFFGWAYFTLQRFTE
jgi:uncharacterized membrane protein YbhN (UPF0104 family)